MSDDHTRDTMQAMARSIDEVINGKPLPEKKDYGFVLLVFGHDGETGNRTNYISNSVRADVIAALKEVAGRLEGQPQQSGRA